MIVIDCNSLCNFQSFILMEEAINHQPRRVVWLTAYVGRSVVIFGCIPMSNF